MRFPEINIATPDRVGPAFVGSDSRASRPIPMRLLNSSSKGRRVIPTRQQPPVVRGEAAEILAEIDGLPILVRFLVQDVPAELRSGAVAGGADFHSLLSSTLEKVVDRMRGSLLRRDDPKRQPLAIVELISGGATSIGRPTPPNESALRVGPLELDLIDRIATRDGRRIDLRPREFKLLKYMMRRSGELLTRATLLKDVWDYKFVPDTNLVDVHMGRLRRNVDAPNEAPLIRNIRGVGFILSAEPVSDDSPPGRIINNRPVETKLHDRRVGSRNASR
jgi:DNA-binding winged helix-turn-helix (wHTH) protein